MLMPDFPATLPKPTFIPTPVVSGFRLKEAIEEVPHFNLSYNIITKFIKEAAVAELENAAIEDDTRLLIIRTINNLYSFITKRNYQASEGQENFFHHIAGDANFEIATKSNIKGKNHRGKLAQLFNEVKKALTTLNAALKNVSAEESEIISKYILKLQAHYNVLLFTLRKLPEEQQLELKKSHKILLKSSKLVYFIISEEDQSTIQNLLVQTPSPHKKQSIADKKTPKKLKSPEKRSASQALLVEDATSNRVKLRKMLFSSTPADSANSTSVISPAQPSLIFNPLLSTSLLTTSVGEEESVNHQSTASKKPQ